MAIVRHIGTAHTVFALICIILSGSTTKCTVMEAERKTGKGQAVIFSGHLIASLCEQLTRLIEYVGMRQGKEGLKDALLSSIERVIGF